MSSSPSVIIIIIDIILTIVVAYKYGYHPSAEERDNLVEEKREMWAGGVLAKDIRYVASWPKQSLDQPGIRRNNFVPKFSITRGPKHPYRKNAKDTIFSGVVSDYTTTKATTTKETKASSTIKTPIITEQDILNFESSVIRPVKKSGLLPSVTRGSAERYHSPSIPIVYGNSSNSRLPIFFTNPVTRIVYAITELGQLKDNDTLSKDSIPIYITKQQHDRELESLKRKYGRRCLFKRANLTRISSVATTIPTHAMRLKKPTDFDSILTISSFPDIPSPLPSPTILQTEITILDSLNTASQRPTNANKIAKPHKKKHLRKRPGRRPSTSVPPRGIYPKIVLGKRPTAQRNPKRLPTQLEEPPNPPVTTFSLQRPVNSREDLNRSKRKTRSVPIGPNREGTEATKIGEDLRNSTMNPPTATSVVELEPSTTEATRSLHTRATFSAQKTTHRVPTRRAVPKNIEKQRRNSKESNEDYDYFGIFYEDSEGDYDDKSVDSDKNYGSSQNNHNGLEDSSYRDDNKDAEVDVSKKKPSKQKTKGLQTYNNTKQQQGNKPNLKQNQKKYVPNDLKGIDKAAILRGNSSSMKDSTDYSAINEIKEETEANATGGTQQSQEGNPESAQLESENQEPVEGEYHESQEYEYQEEPSEIELKTKHSPNRNKQILKPFFGPYGDFYDDDNDDEDEDDGGGGIGGFFNTILYPVNFLMRKLFDDVDVNIPEEGPSYTQYHSNPIEDGNDADEKQGDSLVDWLGSWFGFSRRTTKKIGGTTSPPSTDEQSSGWLESWFSRGNTMTTTEPFYQDIDDPVKDNDDKWFFGWFGGAKSKPKRRRVATQTPSTPTPIPQTPILTIVDPMRNPQNWIGILSHHLVNTTTTQRPRTTNDPNAPRKVDYAKHQIWRLRPQDEDQVGALEEYKRSADGTKLQWLRGPSLRGLNDVLVPPHVSAEFEATLSFESIAHEVLIFDVGKVIAYESSDKKYHDHKEDIAQHQSTSKPPPRMSWNRYYEFDEIVKYLESMRLRYPQVIELIYIGRSYEGRPLIVVKIELKQETAHTSANAAKNARKRLRFKKKRSHANAVFIEAGTHGVEWIGPATATWMINELLRIMKSNKTIAAQESIKKTVWYILPVLNPDGYAYSHQFDRFWKKSRSRYISRPASTGLISSALTWLQQRKIAKKVCHGVDLDRNWRHQFNQRGNSLSPCSEFYAGPVPFSEPETKALSQFLMDYKKQIKLHMSLQAYGQLLSYPNDVDASLNSNRMDELLDVALMSTDGLRKKGSKTRYKINSNNDLIEKRSGCSDAYAAFEVGVPFSYTLYLGDNGVHGYLLPSSSIEPTARDAFEVITAMMTYIPDF